MRAGRGAGAGARRCGFRFGARGGAGGGRDGGGLPVQAGGGGVLRDAPRRETRAEEGHVISPLISVGLRRAAATCYIIGALYNICFQYFVVFYIKIYWVNPKFMT